MSAKTPAFRSWTADHQLIDAFRLRARGHVTQAIDVEENHTLPLHIFEWVPGEKSGNESSGIKSVADLEVRNQATVRIVCAPRDEPSPSTVDGMCELFEKCEIPSAFIREGLQGVSQSFSAQKNADSTCIFSHVLMKDVAISHGRIVNDEGWERRQERTQVAPPQPQSQANFSWLKTGFVLKIRNNSNVPPIPNRARTSSSQSTLVSNQVRPKVEMLCFGAPVIIRNRLQKLKDCGTCEDILLDPYVLLEMVLGEMFTVMDQTGWALSDIFGKIEKQTLDIATTPGRATKGLLDFQGLHNLAKHNIYLRENCESALATLDALREHHKSVIGNHPTPSQEITRQALSYQRTLVQSTERRLCSMDRRIVNIIQLSFNIVTQGDSKLMQSESQSMKTIAVMTLFFMPLSTIAGVFGTEFIKIEDGPGNHIKVSQDFWLLFLIAVPLTVIVIAIWRVWYADAKGRLTGKIPHDAKRRMGWKTLRWTLGGAYGSDGARVAMQDVSPRREV